MGNFIEIDAEAVNPEFGVFAEGRAITRRLLL